jgi:hypothetical protein
MVYVLFEAGLKYFSGHHGHHINYPYLLGMCAPPSLLHASSAWWCRRVLTQCPASPLLGGQLAYEQYLYAVGITLVEYVAYLLAVVISARLLLANTTHSAIKYASHTPHTHAGCSSLTRSSRTGRYNYLAMAVILSSFGKPLHIFLMVWCVLRALCPVVRLHACVDLDESCRDYQQLFSTILDVFVVISNIMAVRGAHHVARLVRACVVRRADARPLCLQHS